MMKEDESFPDSGMCLDSGEIKETAFKFPRGSAPGPRSLLRVNSMPNNSNTPSRKTFFSKGLLAMAPTALCFSPTTDDSPLKCSPSTSLDEDNEKANNPYDDGFVDVCGDNKENYVPSNLSSLFNSPVLFKPEMSLLRTKPPMVRRLSEEPTPKTILSLKSRCHSFDMRSRPFANKKRSEREDDSYPITPLFKRRGSVIDSQNEVPAVVKPSPRTLQRCKSEIAIKTALSGDNCEENLIGDYSREYCLPLCPSKHLDLKGISSTTLKDLINGEYDHAVEKYLIVDCRYPYEYDGGHINGAVNLYTKEEIVQTFLESSEWRQNPKSDKRVIIIFHCEFSSERGPRMSRFVRNHDRDVNKDSYPSLFYPELYLLEGGYKAFYEQVPHLCHNGRYKTMLDKAHSEDLKFFRAKSNHGLMKRK